MSIIYDKVTPRPYRKQKGGTHTMKIKDFLKIKGRPIITIESNESVLAAIHAYSHRRPSIFISPSPPLPRWYRVTISPQPDALGLRLPLCILIQRLIRLGLLVGILAIPPA